MPSIAFHAVQRLIDDLTDDHLTILSPTGGLSRIIANDDFALIRRNISSQVKLASFKD